MLLLHGLSSAGPVWWTVGESLATHRIAASAPDLRGHGGSDHAGNYGIDAYAADVISSCPGPWDLVVGHSLGGAVAVATSELDPDFAAGLLLVDPAIEIARPDHADLADRLAGEVDQPASVDELLEQNPGWSREAAHRKREAILATSADVMRGSIEHNAPWELADRLAALEVPVHILGADPGRDALFRFDLFDRLRSSQPELTFAVVAGAGHSIFRDDPEAVVEAVLDMLDRVAPSSVGDRADQS